MLRSICACLGIGLAAAASPADAKMARDLEDCKAANRTASAAA